MKIKIAGQDALIVYFADAASASVSTRIQLAVSNIRSQMSDIVIDLVPSYASLLIIFNIDQCDLFEAAGLGSGDVLRLQAAHDSIEVELLLIDLELELLR